MIIDAHVHVGTLEQWNPAVVDTWFEPFGLESTSIEVSTEELINRLDEAGVDKAIILAFNCKRHMGVHIPNEYVHAILEQYPGRFIGFCSFDPLDYHAPKQLEEARNVWGFRGVKLSPTYQDVDPADPVFLRFLEKCSDLEMPVLLHHGFTGNTKARSKWQQPWQIDEILISIPNLRLTIAHLGTPHQREVLDLMLKHQHLYADVSARNLDTFGGGIDQLRRDLLLAIRYGVGDRIFWGSDYPFVTPKESLAQLESLKHPGVNGESPIPSDVLRSMKGANLMRLLDP